MAAQVRVGISGWRYPPWRGHFYPQGLKQANELAYASRQFPAIELNGSFYALQRPTSFVRWANDTPAGFVFTIKAPRYITHILRLQDARPAVANFFASGLFALGAKLGPLLWQLPPSLAFDGELLEAFLALLPHDTDAAAALAREREARMQGKEWLQPTESLRIRHALEVRHESFCCPEFVDLLRKYRVALVVADTGGRWPEVGDVTADFLYLRLHGAKQLYATGYSDEELKAWAERIRAWASGSDADLPRLSEAPAPRRAKRNVFCFFDNTMKLHAPENALRLSRALGLDSATLAIGS